MVPLMPQKSVYTQGISSPWLNVHVRNIDCGKNVLEMDVDHIEAHDKLSAALNLTTT